MRAFLAYKEVVAQDDCGDLFFSELKFADNDVAIA